MKNPLKESAEKPAACARNSRRRLERLLKRMLESSFSFPPNNISAVVPPLTVRRIIE